MPELPPIEGIRLPTEVEAKKIAKTLTWDEENIKADSSAYAFYVVKKLVWELTNPDGNRKKDIESAAIYGHTIKTVVRRLQEQLEDEKSKKRCSGCKHDVVAESTSRKAAETQTETEESLMKVDNDTNKAREKVQGFLPALKELVQRVKRLKEKLSLAGESGYGRRPATAVTKGDIVGQPDCEKRPEYN